MLENLIFENPKYYIIDSESDARGITSVVNGVHTSFICREGDDYYDEIMRQVEAGTVTIADAD